MMDVVAHVDLGPATFDGFDVTEIRDRKFGGCVVVLTWGDLEMPLVSPAEAYEVIEDAVLDAEMEWEVKRPHEIEKP